jgi:hypothetical protein
MLLKRGTDDRRHGNLSRVRGDIVDLPVTSSRRELPLHVSLPNCSDKPTSLTAFLCCQLHAMVPFDPSRVVQVANAAGPSRAIDHRFSSVTNDFFFFFFFFFRNP